MAECFTPVGLHEFLKCLQSASYITIRYNVTHGVHFSPFSLDKGVFSFSQPFHSFYSDNIGLPTECGLPDSPINASIILFTPSHASSSSLFFFFLCVYVSVCHLFAVGFLNALITNLL